MRPEILKKWLRPLRLKARLIKHFPKSRRPRFKILTTSPLWDMVELQRDDGCLTLVLASPEKIAEDHVHYYYRAFLPVAVNIFSRASVRRAVVELRDYPHAECDHMVFCANFHNALLIPDPEFFNSNGYASYRGKLQNQRAWHERTEMIVWRGSTTGSGLLPHQSPDLVASDVIQRIRLCALLKASYGTDVKIYRVVQSSNSKNDEDLLRRAGILGGALPEDSWLDQKFAFDIDGNSNAWRNLFTRLLFGCCVLKVASPHNFRQWYYDRLEPWTHYVPIDANLSNLVERIDWCRSHPAECGAIAARGQALAFSMTLQKEICWAIDRVNQRLDGTG